MVVPAKKKTNQITNQLQINVSATTVVVVVVVVVVVAACLKQTSPCKVRK